MEIMTIFTSLLQLGPRTCKTSVCCLGALSCIFHRLPSRLSSGKSGLHGQFILFYQ